MPHVLNADECIQVDGEWLRRQSEESVNDAVHSVFQDALLIMISVKDLNAQKDSNGLKLDNFVDNPKKEELLFVAVLTQNDLFDLIRVHLELFF